MKRRTTWSTCGITPSSPPARIHPLSHPLGLFLLVLVLAGTVTAANDPGHDTLYVLKVGDNMTGSLNTTGNITATFLRATALIYGNYLDIWANGTLQTVTSRPAIQAPNGNSLYLDSTQNIYIATQGGTTNVVQFGPTGASNLLVVNVSGTLLQQNIPVCLANGTNCLSGTNTGNITSINAGNGISVTNPNGPTVTVAANPGSGLTISGTQLVVDNTTVCRSSGAGCPAGGGLTGSGAAGNITMWQTNSTNLAGSVVYQSGNNVGIGTATPSNIFQISRDDSLTTWSSMSAIAGFKNSNITDNTGVLFAFQTNTDTGLNRGFARIGGVVTNHTAGNVNGDLVIDTMTADTSSEKMRIKSSGNVGLGTTAPTQKLDVNGSINSTEVYIGGGGIKACRSDGTNCPAGATNGVGWTNTSGGGNVSLVNNAVNVSANTLFVDNTNAKAGVNTTTPGETLDVQGSMRRNVLRYFTLSRTINESVVGNYIYIGNFTQTDAGIYARFTITGLVANSIQSVEYEFHNTDWPTQTSWIQLPLKAGMGFGGVGDFVVDVRENTSTSALVEARVRIINTNSQYALPLTIQVETNTAFTSDNTTGTGAVVVPGYLNQRSFEFPVANGRWTNTNQGLFIVDPGNVGIGTTGPSVPLEINGSAMSNSGGTVGNNFIVNRPNNASYASFLIRTANSDKWSVGLRATQMFLGFFDEVAGQQRMVIDTSGNVGINTTVPGQTLDVRGTALVNSSVSTGSFQVVNTTGGTHLLVNGTSGRVGIGTATPNTALDVTTNNTVTPATGGMNSMTISDSDTTASSISGIQFRSNDDGSAYRHSAAIVSGKDANWVGGSGVYPGYLSFWTRTAVVGQGELERMRITGEGLVGINDSAPTATLSVKSSNPAGTLNVQSASGTSVLFVNASVGNVGIGTTTPTTALTVIGSLNVSAGTIYAGATNLTCSQISGCVVGAITNVPYQSSAAGWTNTTTTSSTSLDVNIGSGKVVANGSSGQLSLTGGLDISQNSVSHYRNVCQYQNSIPSVIGTMKITMPNNWTNTMLVVHIVGYDYSGIGQWEAIVSGYNYAAGPFWVNYRAEIRGRAPFNQIRLANDGSKNIILLGTTSSTWSYPKILVTDVIAGHASPDRWGTGWSITNITDETPIIFSVTAPVDQYTGSTGNFGIGTTTPTEKLAVVGNISSTTGAVFATSSGSLGIGTGAPVHKLHVVSSSAQEGIIVDAATYPELVYQRGTVTKGYLAVAGSANGYGTGTLADSLVLRSENALHLMSNAGTIGLTVATSGSVGINTTAPNQALTVNGSISISLGTSTSPASNGCLILPGGAKLCGNSTCAVIYSPNGLTNLTVCN